MEQPKNPLHGVTLAEIVTRLQAFYGWEELGRQINVRCFTHDPSISSSLKFLRRTPWAREKVESFYLFHLRELKRRGLTGEGAPLSSTAVPEEAVSPEIVEVAPVEMATPEEMALPGEVAPRIGQWEPW